jgi:hypothetical protein
MALYDSSEDRRLRSRKLSNQKVIISSSSVLRKARKPVPAAFAVVSTQQSALGPRGGLWPLLLVGNP